MSLHARQKRFDTVNIYKRLKILSTSVKFLTYMHCTLQNTNTTVVNLPAGIQTNIIKRRNTDREDRTRWQHRDKQL